MRFIKYPFCLDDLDNFIYDKYFNAKPDANYIEMDIKQLKLYIEMISFMGGIQYKFDPNKQYYYDGIPIKLFTLTGYLKKLRRKYKR